MIRIRWKMQMHLLNSDNINLYKTKKNVINESFRLNYIDSRAGMRRKTKEQ